MVDTIEVGKDIESPISGFIYVADKMITVEDLMGVISNQLKDNRWEGESKEKCTQIHEAIIIYCDRIKELCDSVHRSTIQLKVDAESFCSNSSNVRLIQTI